MPTDTASATRFTDQACRTATGTQVHAADPRSSRTHCGCRVTSQLSRRDLLTAHARGSLCLKCWPGLIAQSTPAEAEAFCDQVNAAWVESAQRLAERNAELDREATELAERKAAAKCPTCGHAAHGANSWCMAGTEEPTFAGEREATGELDPAGVEALEAAAELGPVAPVAGTIGYCRHCREAIIAEHAHGVSRPPVWLHRNTEREACAPTFAEPTSPTVEPEARRAIADLAQSCAAVADSPARAAALKALTEACGLARLQLWNSAESAALEGSAQLG